MSGPVDIYRQVATKWSALTNAIAPDQWGHPTPCAEWNVRQLVEHVNAWQTQGGNLLGMDIPAGAAWADIQAAFDATLSDPSQLTGTVPEFGGIPKSDLAGFLIGDLLIHCWDLARSIGADDALPPAAVEATTLGLHHAPESLLRGTNPLGAAMMAAAVAVPDDASVQDKMIAYTGRRP
ncbi:MAG TPA: TIGR03086 family metal-binding protein [Acidimicrobiales bacterium]